MHVAIVSASFRHGITTDSSSSSDEGSSLGGRSVVGRPGSMGRSLPAGHRIRPAVTRPPEGLRRGVRRLWASSEPVRPLLIVLGGGLLLRVYLMAIYSPIAAGFNDSIVYLTSSHDHLFGDPFRPAGYPFFLRLDRYLTDELWFVISLQHLFGLTTAALLYLTVRRITRTRWLSALPAAIVALSGDQLLLEHSLLTESLYTVLVTGAVCGAILAFGSSRPVLLLAVSGFALGAAGTVRTVAVPLVLLIPIWLAMSWRGPMRTRFIATISFAAPAAAVLLT